MIYNQMLTEQHLLEAVTGQDKADGYNTSTHQNKSYLDFAQVQLFPLSALLAREGMKSHCLPSRCFQR